MPLGSAGDVAVWVPEARPGPENLEIGLQEHTWGWNPTIELPLRAGQTMWFGHGGAGTPRVPRGGWREQVPRLLVDVTLTSGVRLSPTGPWRDGRDYPYQVSFDVVRRIEQPQSGDVNPALMDAFWLSANKQGRPILVETDDPTSGTAGPGADRVAIEIVEVLAASSDGYNINLASNSVEAFRAEGALVQRYKAYLEARGSTVRRHRYRLDGGVIECDLFDETQRVLVEAKSSCQRPDVRMAIGQLADYRRFETDVSVAVLLPERPPPDITRLIHSYRAVVVWSEGDGFTESAPDDSTFGNQQRE